VLRNLDVLESLVRERFVVCRFYKDAAFNSPKLRELLPTNQPPLTVPINAGVIGIDKVRDDQLFSWWIYCCVQAFVRRDVREHVTWCDQGALAWAIEKANASHLIESDRWNAMVSVRGRGGQSVNDPGLLDWLMTEYPHVDIVHWIGTVKPFKGPGFSPTIP